MDDASLTRRDLLKLTAFGTAAVAVPLIGTASAKDLSELPSNLLPRPYVRQETFIEPEILRVPDAPGQRPLVTIRQVQADLQVLPRGPKTRMWVYQGTRAGF